MYVISFDFVMEMLLDLESNNSVSQGSYLSPLLFITNLHMLQKLKLRSLAPSAGMAEVVKL